MAIRKFIGLGVVALGLSACGGTDVATRAAPAGAGVDGPVIVAKVPAYNVTAVNVVVPTDLKVSEANLYYPRADIVWREEPRGDRYQQVQAIMAEGLGNAIDDLSTGREVVVDVVLRRFHSLTEKARFSVGGVHNIIFDMSVRDAATGETVMPAQTVEIDLQAYGGNRAMEAVARGQTQRVRIVAHLENVLKRELSVPISGPTADAAVTRHIMGLPQGL